MKNSNKWSKVKQKPRKDHLSEKNSGPLRQGQRLNTVTTPPKIILYYRLNHSIWSLSDNKESFRWVLPGLHPVNHLTTQRGSNVCIKTPSKESPECLTN
jgi:hypothetical protein